MATCPRRSGDDHCAFSRCWRADGNHPLRKIASQVVRRVVYQSWFSPLPRRRRQSRSWRINLPATSDFLDQESDNHKECVENPNARDGLPGRQWIARHICITYLDDNERGSESNHGSSTNSRHHISRQVKQNPYAKQPDFQCKKTATPIIKAADFV